jgi:hypothetical protein
MLFNLVGKTKQTYVILILIDCVFVTLSFSLWMSKGAHDIFALVVNFKKKIKCQNIL